MFFFFGISPKTKRHGFVMQSCQVHGGSAWHELASYRSWFKLFFFLPLFPVGREHHVLTCSECGAAYDLAPDEAQQLAMQARHDVDVPMNGGPFAGGLLGQLFGGGQPVDDRRDPAADQRAYRGEPYAPAGQQDEVYTTTPQPAPDQPMRVQSHRLDRGA